MPKSNTRDLTPSLPDFEFEQGRNVDTSYFLEGGCVCGKVRYASQSAPFASDYCHCDTCRRLSGAPITAWMDFKSSEVTFHGQISEFQTSEKIYRGFCSDCGSRLTYRHVDHPDYITLTVTSLDNPEQVTPTYHIYTEERLHWLTVEDELPRYAKGQTSYSEK